MPRKMCSLTAAGLISTVQVSCSMLLSHEDLVLELPKLEKLNASERKRLNDNRRAAQLERWKKSQGEEDEKDEKRPVHPEKRKKNSRPYFDPGLILLNCAALGDLEGVRKLLSEGVNPTVYNVDRITPLHQSCLENDEEITQLLIEAGCDIDSLDNELWTPLHAAVSLANYECVQLLLKNNANQLSPNVDGQLPIDLCEDKMILALIDRDLQEKGITQNDLAEARTSQETKFFNEVRQLLEHGGNPNFQLLDNDATLLHVAAANGYVEVALYILSKSCKVDIQDIDGWTPLHAAAFWGEVDIIELLGAHGADFKIRTFSGERPVDLTEDDDIKKLLQRLSERSELMKKHPGGALRPSSVRGRLVSRMTTGEREDKRRESAELHNVFVEQIEQDVSKPPDSWRVRTGKYVRPALRDVSFESPTIPEPIAQKTIPETVSHSKEMADVELSPRPSLERSNSISESSEDFQANQAEVLSSICENGEIKESSSESEYKSSPGKEDLFSNDHMRNADHFNKAGPDSTTESRQSRSQQGQVSVDDATFELISPSTDTLASDGTWNSGSYQANKTKESVVCANKSTMRKEKSIDDLASTDEHSFKGAASSSSVHKPLSRSVSLLNNSNNTPRRGNVKRYYSFRGEMHDGPRYSPKPSNNRTAYKNRKKANSSASKHSGAEDDTLTNSFHSSGDAINSCLVTLPGTPRLQDDEKEDSVQEPIADPVKRPSCQPSTSSAPDNSMATHAGSLSGGQDYPVNNEQEVTAETKDKKSRKCCVIL
ncbi:hypothetical protein ACHWQZ_G012067 [Mnemiopsis leidyi]